MAVGHDHRWKDLVRVVDLFALDHDLLLTHTAELLDEPYPMEEIGWKNLKNVENPVYLYKMRD